MNLGGHSHENQKASGAVARRRDERLSAAGCGSDSSADTTSGDDAANPSDTAAADSDLAQIEDAGKLKIGYTV